MKINFSKRHILILFLVLCAIILYVAGLFVDVTRDGAKYALISKELLASGDFLKITLFGKPYIQKPPLLFWISAVSFSLFGVSNFAFKLPLLLLSLAGVYFTYRLAEGLYNKKVGFLSAIVVVFSQAFLLYNADIHTDTLMMPFVILSIWQISLYLREQRIRYLLIGSFAVGLSLLAKGPVGMAIVVFAIGGQLFLQRDLKRIFDPKWALGLLVVFIVASPAIIFLYKHFGEEGLKFYFWTNNVGRFTGEYVKTRNDVAFYIHTLLYLYFPWSLFFFVASWFEVRRIIRKRLRSNDLFVFLGIWILIVVLSISKSKMPNYIYPVIPLMSILTAKWIYYASRTTSRSLVNLFCFSQFASDVTIAGLIIIMLTYLFTGASILLVGFVLLFFFVYFFLRYKYKMKLRPFWLSLVAIVCLNLTFCFHIYSYVMNKQAGAIAAREYNQLSKGKGSLFIYNDENFEMLFYAEGKVDQINEVARLKETLENNHNSWIMMSEEKYQSISGMSLPMDTVITIHGACLNKGLRYLNPETRDKNLERWYLLGRY